MEYTMTTHMNYRKEHIIYTSIWLLLYLSPLASLYMRMSSNPNITFSWHEILNAWEFNTVWLVLMLIHNFLLLPILILKRRTWKYLMLASALLISCIFASFVIRPGGPRFDDMDKRMEMSDCNYYICGESDSCHAPGLCQKMEHDPKEDMCRKPIHGGKPFPRPRYNPDELRPISPVPMLGPGEAVAFFGGLLLMGMNLGVKLYFKTQEDREQRERLEKQDLERQLEYLRYQVNPHFFMNTLNNIHALVDINPERAKTTIVELSKMMRYILYEGDKKYIPVQREALFLNNYIELMRLRYSSRVSISLDMPEMMPDVMLPPLLLIIFVENAFKHGVSYAAPSFIDIKVEVTQDKLKFRCRNSRQEQKPDEKRKKGGVGLANARRRLDLLFPNRYNLEIKENDKEYDVQLEIPLSKNNS